MYQFMLFSSSIFFQFPLNWFVPFKGQRFRPFWFLLMCSACDFSFHSVQKCHYYTSLLWTENTIPTIVQCSAYRRLHHVPLYFPWSEQLLAGLFWITLTLPGNFPQNFRWTHLHPSKRWVIISKKRVYVIIITAENMLMCCFSKTEKEPENHHFACHHQVTKTRWLSGYWMVIISLHKPTR